MKLQLTVNRNGRVKPENVNIVAREINRIQRRDGTVTAVAVVEEARPESSPIHKYFTWDDTQAAEAYRRWQARMLIASVRVIYDGAKEATSVRAFVNVISNDGEQNERGYIGIARVLSDKDLRAQMLDDAMSEINEWRERYNHLTELASIFDAIEKITH